MEQEFGRPFSETTLYYRLARTKQGLRDRKKAGKLAHKTPEQTKRDLHAAKLYQMGYSTPQIAEKMGEAKSAARKRILRTGMKLRSPSEAHLLPSRRGRTGAELGRRIVALRTESMLTWKEIGERVGCHATTAKYRALAYAKRLGMNKDLILRKPTKQDREKVNMKALMAHMPKTDY